MKKFINSLHNDQNFRKYLLLKDGSNKLLESFGNIKKFKFNYSTNISWFEMPYVFNHLNFKLTNELDTNKLSLIDLLKQKNNNFICIFLRPSLTNLIEDIYSQNSFNRNFKIEDGGNDIYFLSKHLHNGLTPEDLIKKKRLSRINKSDLNNKLFIGNSAELNEKGYFSELAFIYKDLMKSKKTNIFYYFSKFWEDPRNLSDVKHKFFISIDKVNHNINAFILLIDGYEQFIFLSACNANGRETNAPSFLRYHVIKYFLETEDANYLNMGGVNKNKGGDESFKKSFGGKNIKYSVFYQINNKYHKILNENNLKFNSEKILFWK